MVHLSILIPTYNGGRYISRCLDSILRQEYAHEKYNIICVDDCSSDNTFSILLSYQEKYSNVKVYRNSKNLRVASSFNQLLSLADGEYIWRVDSDDIVEEGALKRIVDDNLVARNPDILLFNYRRVREDESVINSPAVFIDSEVMDGVDFIRQEFALRDYCNYLLGYTWRSVSRRSVWVTNNIRCVDGINYDDSIIMLKALICSERALSISDYLYKYRVNDGSITFHRNFVKRGLKIYEYAFDVGREVEQFYNEIKVLYPDLAENLLAHLRERYNNFTFDLIRTTISAKFEFYENINRNKTFVASKMPFLNWKSRLLLIPCIGLLIAIACQWVYRLKKNLF